MLVSRMPCLVALAVVAALAALGCGRASDRPPNLLLVVIDTPATVNLIGHHGSAGQRGSFEQELQEEVQSKLQVAVDRAAEAGVRALGHLTFSEDVEEQILKEALVERVDLILVRSRGRTGIMKALLGSTAGEILKAAPCPVLVARA